MKTLVFENSVGSAAEIIMSGGVAAVPTETVYGLAANALDRRAVERVFEAKGRPETKPVSIFVTDMKSAENFCCHIPEAAYRLANAFWPGPLTMILKRRGNVPDTITAGGETVGIRCPDNKLVLELLRETGIPLTGTSANLSGEPDAIDFDCVMKYFDGKIECAIDGGECPGGVPSTVVDMTSEPPVILRHGGIPDDDIWRALNT